MISHVYLHTFRVLYVNFFHYWHHVDVGQKFYYNGKRPLKIILKFNKISSWYFLYLCQTFNRYSKQIFIRKNIFFKKDNKNWKDLFSSTSYFVFIFIQEPYNLISILLLQHYQNILKISVHIYFLSLELDTAISLYIIYL